MKIYSVFELILFHSVPCVCSVDGEIWCWDVRADKMINTINLKQGVMSVEVHNYADILAWWVAYSLVLPLVSLL